jgi:hypothetical protein
LQSHQRPGLENASASESDKYEELIVNPTLLKCATQRGNIDCGGLRGLVVAYGSFLELMIPISGGHLSVGFQPTGIHQPSGRTVCRCLTPARIDAGARAM